MATEIGCVVVSLRDGKESLVLHTPDGEVVIVLDRKGASRSKVVIRAPRSIGVSRRKIQEGATQ